MNILLDYVLCNANILFRDRSPAFKLEAHQSHWWEDLKNRAVHTAGPSQTESVSWGHGWGSWYWIISQGGSDVHTSLKTTAISLCTERFPFGDVNSQGCIFTWGFTGSLGMGFILLIILNHHTFCTTTVSWQICGMTYSNGMDCHLIFVFL